MEKPTTSIHAAFSSAANQTNDTWCSERTEDWTYDVVQGYILVISVLGILLNLFVILVLWFHKKPCTVAEIYLGNLAAADLVLLSFLPFWAISAANKFHWPFGDAMCRIVNLSIIMNLYCSIYFLVLVSIDRYLALVKLMSNKRARTKKCAMLGCLLVWVLGLLLSVPTIVYRKVKDFSQPNITFCYLDYPNNSTMLLSEVMLTTFSFIIPMPIISYCTWKIIQALKNRLTNVITAERKEQKASTLILAVLLAFFICFVPFHIVKIMELLYRMKVLTECRLRAVIGIGKQIFMNLTFFNCVLNPILYVIVGKNFQKKVKEIFNPSSRKIRGTFSRSSKFTYVSSRKGIFKPEGVR